MNNLTDEQLLTLARRAAVDHGQEHSYTPCDMKAAEAWCPHDWVLFAMREAVALAAAKDDGK